jgi:hypothetical protein
MLLFASLVLARKSSAAPTTASEMAFAGIAAQENNRMLAIRWLMRRG